MEVVITHNCGDDEHIVLMTKSREYAVCRMDFNRMVASAPNYFRGFPNGILSASLSKDGLEELLDWTDRESAMRRYSKLVSGTDEPPIEGRLLHIVAKDVSD